MIFQSLLLIAAGYLLGSIPTAYLVSRLVRGIDIRRYGSGTASGSMVWEHVARWAIVPVGLLDILKAAFPAWLGLELGLSQATSAAAGLAAGVGHNWSVYLRFTGGRGLSTFMGTWLPVFPLGFPWMLAFLAFGFALGDSAPLALVSLITLPFFARAVSGPDLVGPVCLAMLLITLAKRLEANRRPLPTAWPDRWRVLLRRAVFDRDIPSHEEWIRRQP